MQFIDKPVSLAQVIKSCNHLFDDMVKIVVDIEREVVGIDAEMHADLEAQMLDQGSEQSNLWGANIYFDKTGDDFIEYTSFINIRPRDNNRGMEVIDEEIRNKIRQIVEKLLQKPS